jgi:RNA polymerase sigma-70 factor, ECF subfamily
VNRLGRSDRRLLDRARSGDEGAFRNLIEPHRGALHAHCYRMLGSPHDAEDALQDTLFRAWRALPAFRGGSQLRTWLRRIATNVCLDAIAGRRKHVPPLDHEAATDAGDGQPEKSMPHAPSIRPYREGTIDGAEGAAPLDAHYERREALELAYIAALRHIPARQRSVLILRDVLGFSAKEAADALTTTVASVNAALLRARRTADERLPNESRDAAQRTIGDRRLRKTAEHFADVFERGEIDAVLALLAGSAPREAGVRAARRVVSASSLGWSW